MLHRKKKAMDWPGETGKWTYAKKEKYNVLEKCIARTYGKKQKHNVLEK